MPIFFIKYLLNKKYFVLLRFESIKTCLSNKKLITYCNYF